VLLVQHSSAHYWGFPKGHPDGAENPKEAAERELIEETGLSVVQYLTDAITTHYTFKNQGQLVDKTVVYFAAITSGNVVPQAAEISDFRWVPLAQADALITYATDKKALEEALSQIE